MRFFLKNQVIVSRLKVVSANRRSFQSTATADASVQQLSDTRGQLGASGVFGKTYKIWCPVDTDIKPGDKAVDEHGIRYDVREVKISTFGAFDYIECIVNKTEGHND